MKPMFLLALLLFALPAHAQTIANPSFEAPATLSERLIPFGRVELLEDQEEGSANKVRHYARAYQAEHVPDVVRHALGILPEAA